MATLAFIKGKKQWKYTMGALLAVLLLGACADNSNLRLLYDDAKNHKVFKISASLYPSQTEVTPSDTLWVTIELPTGNLQDLVSEKHVSVGEAQYICQLELANTNNEDQVVDATFILEEGALYEDHSTSSTTTKNGYGFTFGAPYQERLKVGILFNQSGSYALWFNNFPNPYHGCKGNNCDQGRGFWFDIYYQWNEASKTFEKYDFVDYIFSSKESEELNDLKAPYLEFGIYPESIRILKVKE